MGGWIESAEVYRVLVSAAIVLSTVPELILTVTLWGRYCYYLHYTDGKLRPREVWPFAKPMCSVVWCWPLNSSLLILGAALPPWHTPTITACHICRRIPCDLVHSVSLHLDSVWALLPLSSSRAIFFPALCPLPTLLTAAGEICLKQQTRPCPSALNFTVRVVSSAFFFVKMRSTLESGVGPETLHV